MKKSIISALLMASSAHVLAAPVLDLASTMTDLAANPGKKVLLECSGDMETINTDIWHEGTDGLHDGADRTVPVQLSYTLQGNVLTPDTGRPALHFCSDQKSYGANPNSTDGSWSYVYSSDCGTMQGRITQAWQYAGDQNARSVFRAAFPHSANGWEEVRIYRYNIQLSDTHISFELSHHLANVEMPYVVLHGFHGSCSVAPQNP
jgi:hypothetical protein